MPSQSRFFRPLSLGTRFALTIFCVGLAFLAASVAFQTEHEEHILRQRSRIGAQVLGDSLASLCVSRLSNGQETELRHSLALLAHLSRIAYIDVWGADRHPIFHLVNPGHARPLGETPADYVEPDNVLDVSVPLMDGDRHLGYLEAGIWMRGVTTEIRHSAHEGYLMGLALAFLLAVFSWVLGLRLSARLRRVSAEIRRRDPMNFSPLDVEGDDEISSVVQTFNEHQDRLREAHDQRRKAERDREDMVNMIVHDLKGPIVAFYAALTILDESLAGKMDDEASELMRLMEKNTRRVQRMIDSVLQVARLESSELPAAKGPVDLRRLAQTRAEETRPAALQRGLRIETPESVPSERWFVYGDAELLARVIDNLLFNAIEHTPAGGRIRMDLKESGTIIRLEVRDSGPGVPDAEKEIIFERFRKATARPSRGMGLGLAFCKLAVARHRGVIGVENAPGGGAIFYFELPSLPAAIDVAAVQHVP